MKRIIVMAFLLAACVPSTGQPSAARATHTPLPTFVRSTPVPITPAPAYPAPVERTRHSPKPTPGRGLRCEQC